MPSLLAVPVAVLALAAPTSPALQPITSAQASSALTSRIHDQVPRRLRAAFSGETVCSGTAPGQEQLTAATTLDSWRCKLELRGQRFPRPCRAEANVFATTQADRVRVRWLTMSRFCREGAGRRAG